MLNRLSLPLKLLGVSACLVALGALLPWASPAGIWIWGIQVRGGPFNLVVALLSIGLLLAYAGLGPVRPGRRTFLIPQFLASWCCIVILLHSLTSYAAFGLYLSFLGAFVWLAATYLEWRRTGPPRRGPWRAAE